MTNHMSLGRGAGELDASSSRHGFSASRCVSQEEQCLSEGKTAVSQERRDVLTGIRTGGRGSSQRSPLSSNLLDSM